MKQRTIIGAGVIALTGLVGLAYAAALREQRVQHTPPAAAPNASARALLSREQREAIVKTALAAAHESVQIGVHKRDAYKIPHRFWGEAVEKLRPLRVINDRMNVLIVLTEDSRNEKGLYVTNPISSHLVGNTDPRFAAFELLSKPEDRSFGGLFRYHIRKKQKPTSLSQSGGRTLRLR